MTAELTAENGTGVARIGVAMEPAWVGCGIAGDGRKDEGLRDVIVKAQNDALDLLRAAGAVMDDLKIRWVIETKDGTGYHWNPQNPLADDVEVLYCIAECVYV